MGCLDVSDLPHAQRISRRANERRTLRMDREGWGAWM